MSSGITGNPSPSGGEFARESRTVMTDSERFLRMRFFFCLNATLLGLRGNVWLVSLLHLEVERKKSGMGELILVSNIGGHDKARLSMDFPSSSSSSSARRIGRK